jgi:hypothetical protein
MDHRKRSLYAPCALILLGAAPRFRGGLELDLGVHLGDSNRIRVGPPSQFGCPCWSPWPPCDSPRMVICMEAMSSSMLIVNYLTWIYRLPKASLMVQNTACSIRGLMTDNGYALVATGILEEMVHKQWPNDDKHTMEQFKKMWLSPHGYILFCTFASFPPFNAFLSLNLGWRGMSEPAS